MPYNVNPMQLLGAIRQGQNPQQLMLSILSQEASLSPMGANLMKLAKENNTQEIEQVARNYLAAQGKDFDTEFAAFKQTLGI